MTDKSVPQNLFRKLCEIIQGKRKPLDGASYSTHSPNDVKLPMLMVQYKDNHSLQFADRLRNFTNVEVIFITRKLHPSLSSLKSASCDELRSSVIYKLSCSGCDSTYVGKLVQLFNTRIEEHKILTL